MIFSYSVSDLMETVIAAEERYATNAEMLSDAVINWFGHSAIIDMPGQSIITDQLIYQEHGKRGLT